MQLGKSRLRIQQSLWEGEREELSWALVRWGSDEQRTGSHLAALIKIVSTTHRIVRTGASESSTRNHLSESKDLSIAEVNES